MEYLGMEGEGHLFLPSRPDMIAGIELSKSYETVDNAGGLLLSWMDLYFGRTAPRRT
jgi:hypothetical protein